MLYLVIHNKLGDKITFFTLIGLKILRFSRFFTSPAQHISYQIYTILSIPSFTTRCNICTLVSDVN